MLPLAACDKKGGKTKTPGKTWNIRVPPPIYGPDTKTPKVVMDRCKFDAELAEAIVDATPGAEVVATSETGKVLNMEIISMRGVDPETQGQRLVIVRGELTNEGTRVGTFRARYTAQGAMVGGVAGVCQGLGEIAELMGLGVAQWIRDPTIGAQLTN
jgi:hypothetical protein